MVFLWGRNSTRSSRKIRICGKSKRTGIGFARIRRTRRRITRRTRRRRRRD